MRDPEEYEQILKGIRSSIGKDINKLRGIIFDDEFSEYKPIIAMVLEGLVTVVNNIDQVATLKEWSDENK